MTIPVSFSPICNIGLDKTNTAAKCNILLYSVVLKTYIMKKESKRHTEREIEREREREKDIWCHSLASKTSLSSLLYAYNPSSLYILSIYQYIYVMPSIMYAYL